MTHEDRASALSVLRSSQDRTLEREGIPMVLALVSEVGQVPPATDPVTAADGRRLATEMDAYRGALVPSSRDDDLGCLITVLQAVSFADFAGPAQPLGAAGVDIASERVGG